MVLNVQRSLPDFTSNARSWPLLVLCVLTVMPPFIAIPTITTSLTTVGVECRPASPVSRSLCWPVPLTTPTLRSTTPSFPKLEILMPVFASSPRRQYPVDTCRIRSSMQSVQYETPRRDKCSGELTARAPSNSECVQSNSPVSALSAKTARRVPPVAYMMPLITSGVPSNLYSGRVPRLSVLKRHATSRSLKFDALIWSRGEYFEPLTSAV